MSILEGGLHLLESNRAPVLSTVKHNGFTNHTWLVQAPKHVICNWGLILVVQADGTVVYLKEKELSSKLELLYNKSLYLLALNLAQSQQVSSALLCLLPVTCCFCVGSLTCSEAACNYFTA